MNQFTQYFTNDNFTVYVKMYTISNSVVLKKLRCSSVSAPHSDEQFTCTCNILEVHDATRHVTASESKCLNLSV